MGDAPPSARTLYAQALPRATLILIGAAALTVTLAGMRAIPGIIGPVLLALVVTITIHPLRTWLEKHRVPEWAASVIMLIAAYLLLALLTLALIVSIAQLASLVGDYTDQIDDIIKNAGDTLESLGVDQKQIDAVTSSIDPGQLVGVATDVLTGTLSVLTNLLFLFLMLLFMAFDTNSTRRSLANVTGRVPDLVAAMGSFAHATRTYMAVSATFGLIVAVIDTVALELMGVPGAFVWGVLAFVTNFIPNIGFVIGVIPPTFIALLDSGWELAVAVIVVYCVIN